MLDDCISVTIEGYVSFSNVRLGDFQDTIVSYLYEGRLQVYFFVNCKEAGQEEDLEDFHVFDGFISGASYLLFKDKDIYLKLFKVYSLIRNVSFYSVLAGIRSSEGIHCVLVFTENHEDRKMFKGINGHSNGISKHNVFVISGLTFI